MRVRAAAAFRASRTAVLNLAGLLYLPVFVLDVRFGSQTLLKTMLHLLLFTTVFKLASIRQGARPLARARPVGHALRRVGLDLVPRRDPPLRRSSWRSSAWAVLVRWALWRDLAAAPEEWEPRPRGARAARVAGRSSRRSRPRSLLAVPLFLFLPRLKAPYVRGAEAGQEITTGFSDTVDPDLFGALKQSDRVFLRITSEEPLGEGAAAVLRLRTLALSRWDGGVWKKPPSAPGTVAPAGDGALVPLARAAARQRDARR